jgi:superoxide oxidase
MARSPTKTRHYDRLSMLFHWLTLAVMIATFATIELRVLFAKGTWARDEIKGWHFALGILILLMTLARIANRLAVRSSPPILPAPPTWQQWLSTAVHWTLYAALIGLPILGWFTLSAAGKPVPLFFGAELPVLIAPDKALAKSLEGLHKQIGNGLYYLIGFHALAAVMHRLVLQDNTLARMLPARRSDAKRPPAIGGGRASAA